MVVQCFLRARVGWLSTEVEADRGVQQYGPCEARKCCFHPHFADWCTVITDLTLNVFDGTRSRKQVSSDDLPPPPALPALLHRLSSLSSDFSPNSLCRMLLQ
ncbi:hypothetical protein CB1_000335025 [Camelus ferus]|nr:hypothetical protein CB1_000335025 [Camelus ferus]